MDNKSSDDRREFSRVQVHLKVTVLAKDKEIVSDESHDVSMKGVFINCAPDWPLGTECEVHMYLEGEERPVDISVKGRVQWITEKGMGLLFTEVGLEAYEHLHNLIMLNTHDPLKVDQEFKEHLGLKKK